MTTTAARRPVSPPTLSARAALIGLAILLGGGAACSSGSSPGSPGTAGTNGNPGSAGAAPAGGGGSAACSTGAVGCACYANNTCNGGLTCLSQLCVSNPAGMGGTTGAA